MLKALGHLSVNFSSHSRPLNELNFSLNGNTFWKTPFSCYYWYSQSFFIYRRISAKLRRTMKMLAVDMARADSNPGIGPQGL